MTSKVPVHSHKILLRTHDRSRKERQIATHDLTWDRQGSCTYPLITNCCSFPGSPPCTSASVLNPVAATLPRRTPGTRPWMTIIPAKTYTPFSWMQLHEVTWERETSLHSISWAQHLLCRRIQSTSQSINQSLSLYMADTLCILGPKDFKMCKIQFCY